MMSILPWYNFNTISIETLVRFFEIIGKIILSYV